MQYIYIVVTGVCFAFIQLLLFRETLPVFQGMELVAGFFFASAITAFFLGFSFPSKQKTHHKSFKKFLASAAILFFLFVISFVFIRYIRLFLSVAPGSAVSLKSAFLFVIILAFPISFFQGYFLRFLRIKGKGLFYLICGFCAGCVVYSIFLFSADGVNASLLILALLSLLPYYKTFNNKQALYMLIIVPAVVLSLTGVAGKLDASLLAGNYANAKIIKYQNTAYGQTVLAEQNNEIFLSENQITEFERPDNRIIDSEDFGHIPLLFHQNPQNILVAGGAARFVPIILQHPVTRVDYVEPSYALLDIITTNISASHDAFSDSRLNVINADVRYFLKHSDILYDVISIGFADPVNLYIDGYYTKDFFEIAKTALDSEGFLAISLPGKLTYSSFVMAKLNESVISALQSVFEYVQVIPGNTNIIIASDKKMPYRINIKRRLYDMQETALVLSKYYLDDKMDSERTIWLNDELAKTGGERANTDINPRAMMLSVIYAQSEYSPYLSVFLDFVVRYSPLFIIFTIAFLVFTRSFKKSFSFFIGGDALWLFWTAVFALQIHGGRIYAWSGLVICALAAGLFAGTMLDKKELLKLPPARKMLYTEIGFFVLFGLWLLCVAVHFVNLPSALIFIFISGTLAGIEMSDSIENGTLHLKTMIGGAVAACLIGAGFLIPVWGILWSTVFILGIKLLLFAKYKLQGNK